MLDEELGVYYQNVETGDTVWKLPDDGEVVEF
jgi:hypothetical protein